MKKVEREIEKYLKAVDKINSFYTRFEKQKEKLEAELVSFLKRKFKEKGIALSGLKGSGIEVVLFSDGSIWVRIIDEYLPDFNSINRVMKSLGFKLRGIHSKRNEKGESLIILLYCRKR